MEYEIEQLMVALIGSQQLLCDLATAEERKTQKALLIAQLERCVGYAKELPE